VRSRPLAPVLSAAAILGTSRCSGGSGGGHPQPPPPPDGLWHFTRGDPSGLPAGLSLGYPAVKAWILPSGNDLVADPARRAPQPAGNLGDGIAYVQASYDDSAWQRVELPHDYAIAGPFTSSVSSNMGRLPSPGAVWYRKNFTPAAGDAGRSVFLDVDGAMSYSTVWLNGTIVGGWPYLPHWTWPERDGQVTPVHVYTSGDEAELFVNGVSQGRKQRGPSDYRLRWDDVVYHPGQLEAVAYKNGVEWARDTVGTAGAATRLLLATDRSTIAADGRDLSFVTATVADAEGQLVPRSSNAITFTVSGPGEIVATDNGNAVDRNAFPSPTRKAFNGLALAIVRARAGQSGEIVVTATASGLAQGTTTIVAQ